MTLSWWQIGLISPTSSFSPFESILGRAEKFNKSGPLVYGQIAGLHRKFWSSLVSLRPNGISGIVTQKQSIPGSPGVNVPSLRWWHDHTGAKCGPAKNGGSTILVYCDCQPVRSAISCLPFSCSCRHFVPSLSDYLVFSALILNPSFDSMAKIIGIRAAGRLIWTGTLL